MAKRKVGSQIPIWLPTIKSQELPQFPCVQVACHILLESFWWGLQLCLKLHLNQRFGHKVMGLQSCRSSNFENFETLGNLGTKWHLGVGPMATHKEYYKGGQWWLPPSLGHCESCESVFAHGLSMHQKCFSYTQTNLFGLCKSVWIIDLLINLPSPHPRALMCPSTLKV